MSEFPCGGCNRSLADCQCEELTWPRTFPPALGVLAAALILLMLYVFVDPVRSTGYSTPYVVNMTVACQSGPGLQMVEVHVSSYVSTRLSGEHVYGVEAEVERPLTPCWNGPLSSAEVSERIGLTP